MTNAWRTHFEGGTLDRVAQADPELDVAALAASLVPRIESGAIRNANAVLVVAAREAKERGTYRKADGDIPFGAE